MDRSLIVHYNLTHEAICDHCVYNCKNIYLFNDFHYFQLYLYWVVLALHPLWVLAVCTMCLHLFQSSMASFQSCIVCRSFMILSLLYIHWDTETLLVTCFLMGSLLRAGARVFGALGKLLTFVLMVKKLNKKYIFKN